MPHRRCSPPAAPTGGISRQFRAAARRRLPARLLVAGLLALALPLLALPAPTAAGDLDATGAVFLRFTLSPRGDGFEPPVLGLRMGPDFGPGRPGNRIETRGRRFPLDRALALELNGEGSGRIALAGFNWRWRITDLVPRAWLSVEPETPAN